MTVFAVAAVPTVVKLVRLLGSDKDHEALGAARALKRVLAAAGLDLHDLANIIEFAARGEAPQVISATADDGDAREMIRRCCERSELLTLKELAFVHSMATKWRGQPTKRQSGWLASIYDKVANEQGYYERRRKKEHA
jgi:hypothetical protein